MQMFKTALPSKRVKGKKRGWGFFKITNYLFGLQHKKIKQKTFKLKIKNGNHEEHPC